MKEPLIKEIHKSQRQNQGQKMSEHGLYRRKNSPGRAFMSEKNTWLLQDILYQESPTRPPPHTEP